MSCAAQEIRCHAPAQMDDGWETASASASGFNAAALCSTLDAAAAGPDKLHGLVVERHGRLVAELYRDGPDKPINVLFGVGRPFAKDAHFGPDVRHDARSVSKSVVGLLVGIARDKGQLGGLSSPVLDFYPEDPELLSARHNRVTLDNLLSMTSGLQWDEGSLPNDETRLYWTTSLLPFLFNRPVVAQPGEVFHYNSGSTAVLADIITMAQGASLTTLAREQLFEPLGISDWEWVTDLRGRELAFTGLRMRPRDMAKLGRLVLDHGQWRGRQVVSPEWVHASITPHIATDIRLPPTAPEPLGYGYQWWTGTTRWNGRNLAWSAAFGNGGQRIFVVPELDMTVVTTAGAYGDGKINVMVNGLLDRIVATVLDPDQNPSAAATAGVTATSESTPTSRPLR
ncbi:serine hydrolase [Variovorax sp. J22R133]|uniref:serine hydrolase domain-containing protein n=1 Tax=Variovorax brevis TaxID=3053503 RepID=UPI00257838C6|nr:serine hydrolase [Variovorax sp. J22R133]MDM0114653.1 serine hydrolase [Variovorax sp. J22R133]